MYCYNHSDTIDLGLLSTSVRYFDQGGKRGSASKKICDRLITPYYAWNWPANQPEWVELMELDGLITKYTTHPLRKHHFGHIWIKINLKLLHMMIQE